MKVAFCIGNGESRRHFDLRKLRNHGPIAGCNALYRDFEPTFLVAIDGSMYNEIASSGYTGRVLTILKDHRDKKYWLVDSKTEERIATRQPVIASGPWSVLAMLRLYPKVQEIFLIGHDFHGVQSSGKNLHNNMYKGTENYRPAEDPATNSEAWVEQLAQSVRSHPDVIFTRVGMVPYLVGTEGWVKWFKTLMEFHNFFCLEWDQFYHRMTWM